jgi:hypothetical protein
VIKGFVPNPAERAVGIGLHAVPKKSISGPAAHDVLIGEHFFGTMVLRVAIELQVYVSFMYTLVNLVTWISGNSQWNMGAGAPSFSKIKNSI